jgi:AbrB family looped-hinge helix DNA binding protein
MPSSTLTSKGQTTIPKLIRDHLKLRSGDQIDFLVRPDGVVVLRPATLNVRELKGMLHRKNMKAVSVDAMNEAIRRRFKGRR